MLNKKLLTLIAFLTLISNSCYSQEWVKTENGAYKLNYLFFQDLVTLIYGPDSSFYIITKHQKDKYWRKRKKGELLVSKIVKPDSIYFFEYLNMYSEEPEITFKRGKYYLADNDPFEYSYVYVFDSLWKRQKRLIINLPEFQQGIKEIDVQKDGNIFLLTSTNSSRRFKHNNYILKYTKDGKEKEVGYYDTTQLSNLCIIGDSISFIRQRFKMKKPYEWSSSKQMVHCDENLKCVLSQDKPLEPKVAPVVRQEYTFINEPEWTTGYNQQITENLVLIELSKRPRYDSIKIILYNTSSGESKLLRVWDSFSNSGIRLYDIRLIKDFYQANRNLLWYFYIVSYRDRHEEIYFDSIQL